MLNVVSPHTLDLLVLSKLEGLDVNVKLAHKPHKSYFKVPYSL
jgi:hypothetical protein